MILGGWILVLLRKKGPAAGATSADVVAEIPARPSAQSHPLLALVIGVGLLFLIGLIPYLGRFVWFLVTVYPSMGAKLVRGGRQGDTLSVTLPA